MQRSTEEGPCDRKGGAFSLRPQRSFVRAENNMQVKSTAMSARAHDIAAVKFPLRFRPTYRNYILHKIQIRIILAPSVFRTFRGHELLELPFARMPRGSIHNHPRLVQDGEPLLPLPSLLRVKSQFKSIPSTGDASTRRATIVPW